MKLIKTDLKGELKTEYYDGNTDVNNYHLITEIYAKLLHDKYIEKCTYIKRVVRKQYYTHKTITFYTTDNIKYEFEINARY